MFVIFNCVSWNITAQSVALLLCIRVIHGFNLGQEIGYPNCGQSFQTNAVSCLVLSETF
jgi:hypothetical protein